MSVVPKMEGCWICVFWSELIARATGSGPLEAICENASSPHSGTYTTGHTRCDQFEEEPAF